MPPMVIVSYDGTVNDDDALALAQMLAGAGTRLGLAYVRHSQEYDPRREEIGAHDAQRRLDTGAVWLDQADVDRHVVIDPSTGAGLTRLALEQDAAMVVFGSDYRTSPGRVEPGQAAQQMLTGGSVAIAVAVAGLRTDRDHAIRRIAAPEREGDDAPLLTAQSLAAALAAELTDAENPSADLIVVGSQPAAPQGRVALSGATRHRLESARSSVLVLPRGLAIEF